MLVQNQVSPYTHTHTRPTLKLAKAMLTTQLAIFHSRNTFSKNYLQLTTHHGHECNFRHLMISLNCACSACTANVSKDLKKELGA